MGARSPRPTGATIVPRLLDAVEALCAQGSPTDATMEKIAREAGVSVGVAYRYFESKDALLGATMDRMAERLAAAVTGSDDTTSATTALWQALEDNPAFARLVTWMVMNGQDVSMVMSKHPVVRDVARTAAERGIADPATVGGATALIGIAGGTYGALVNRAMGRDDDDHRLDDAMAEMLTDWIEKRSADGSGG